MGGGFYKINKSNGKFGLWISEDLDNGHSSKCQTYNNEILSKDHKFLISQLEIWGIEM